MRESLTWVVQQLMEAEVSELIGAEHGERNPDWGRSGARIGARFRRCSAAGAGHSLANAWARPRRPPEGPLESRDNPGLRRQRAGKHGRAREPRCAATTRPTSFTTAAARTTGLPATAARPPSRTASAADGERPSSGGERGARRVPPPEHGPPVRLAGCLGSPRPQGGRGETSSSRARSRERVGPGRRGVRRVMADTRRDERRRRRRHHRRRLSGPAGRDQARSRNLPERALQRKPLRVLDRGQARHRDADRQLEDLLREVQHLLRLPSRHGHLPERGRDGVRTRSRGTTASRPARRRCRPAGRTTPTRTSTSTPRAGRTR